MVCIMPFFISYPFVFICFLYSAQFNNMLYSIENFVYNDYNREIIKSEIVNLSDGNFLRIQYADKKGVFLVPGEAFNIKITTQQNAYIYCYFEDQNGEVVRFFPNRFTDTAFISAQSAIVLPGEEGFKLSASMDGVSERIACFSAVRDIFRLLPEAVKGKDFEKLPVTSLEQVRDLFVRDKNMIISDSFFNIRVF